MTHVRLLIAAAAMPVVLFAQQPAFKSGVELVRIPVSVTQGDKPAQPGIVNAADFRLTEDGVPQQITLFERESLPLSVAVVFDASASMGEDTVPRRASVALQQVASRLLPEDEMAVILFAQKPRVLAPWSPAPEILKLQVSVEAVGPTALHDAVVTAFGLMEQAKNPKPVVLVISDGGENASKATLSDIVTTRRQGETLVYAFNIAPLGDPLRVQSGGTVGFDTWGPPSAPSSLGRSPVAAPRPVERAIAGLVGDSGGVEYRVLTEREVPNAARAFIDDLRFQYTIGYTPTKPLDGKYRRVKVEINKRGFRVRHRGGYLAVPVK